MRDICARKALVLIRSCTSSTRLMTFYTWSGQFWDSEGCSIIAVLTDTSWSIEISKLGAFSAYFLDSVIVFNTHTFCSVPDFINWTGRVCFNGWICRIATNNNRSIIRIIIDSIRYQIRSIQLTTFSISIVFGKYLTCWTSVINEVIFICLITCTIILSTCLIEHPHLWRRIAC